MLAIGNGAQQEILDQIRLVGVNNMSSNPSSNKRRKDRRGRWQEEKKKFSPGLTFVMSKHF